MRRAWAVLAVAVVAGGVGLRSCERDGSSSTAQPAAGEQAPKATESSPRSRRDGVAVGWGRDAAGAEAAAVSAVSLTGDIAKAGFITRADMIAALASRGFAATLAETSTGQLTDLLGELAGDGIPVASILFRELPLTSRVVEASSMSARVDVWAVLVIGAEQLGAPRQLWRTVTVTLVWEDDDWRVDGWTAKSGPTPALASNSAVAAADELVEVASWPAAGGDR